MMNPKMTTHTLKKAQNTTVGPTEGQKSDGMATLGTDIGAKNQVAPGQPTMPSMKPKAASTIPAKVTTPNMAAGKKKKITSIKELIALREGMKMKKQDPMLNQPSNPVGVPAATKTASVSLDSKIYKNK